jgi:FMN phosphatase YigB (HAD superfamily)
MHTHVVVSDRDEEDLSFEATFDGNRMGDFPFMPEVAGMLQHLASKNIAAVIITNGHHKVQRDKLAACDAAALFPEPAKVIVGGEEVLEGREEKPAVTIFAKACEAAGCTPEEAIHVGDSLATDVQVRGRGTEGGGRYYSQVVVLLGGIHFTRVVCVRICRNII